MRKTNFSTHFFSPVSRIRFRAARDGKCRTERIPGSRRDTAGSNSRQNDTAGQQAETGIQIDTAGTGRIKQDDRRRRAG